MKFWLFLKECRAELEKVSWPSKDEVYKSTGVVLGTVIVFSLFLFFVDSLFVKGLTWLWSAVAR
ncbi:MAG TPA: preprotein translocase subunit SecE [Leptospiraceae bacterium]|nr:preprotein translocase subunit SecE [Leptospiraceae bacterium]HMY68067.1 preprotein translocase subunit SecE [Leptospiraceae bacterium]HNF27486.1 preprotein translocase subunit SecE [Leptospiraceae bacterium]HNI27474.1 preprotein translocase subunit SecE [Leptospiraceae bacterium]HNI95693.1 preprotein translocase subunit SecE [Leptospiraceae bacterium]